MSSTPVSTPAGPVPVTLSIGVGVADRDASLDDLLRAADLALYRAKDAGRDRACARRVTRRAARDLTPHREP